MKRRQRQGERFSPPPVAVFPIAMSSSVIFGVPWIRNMQLFTHLSFREIVLGRLAALLKKFVHKISLAQGLSETAASTAGGKIFTFGSYRLGVHGPGSDIDTLCVVPKHVSREDFFEVLESMLKETEGVTEVSVCIHVGISNLFQINHSTLTGST